MSRLSFAIAWILLAPAALRAQEPQAPRDSQAQRASQAPRDSQAPRNLQRPRNSQAPQGLLAPQDSLESQAPQKPRTIARYGFSDGAVAIDVRPGGIIAIAAAQGDSAATVALRARDARAWTDSTRRFVTRLAPRKRTQVVLQRSMVEEAADSGGAISFLRRAASDTTTFELLFSTRSFGKFPLALERREAVLFFAAMQRAVDATRPPAPAKPARKPRPKPQPKPQPDSTTP